MLHDLKNACRALLKAPWFTCVVVVTLALGIGANTAIFGVVNTLLLNPLPYPNADRLVFIRLGNDSIPFGFPLPGFVVAKWREEARSFDAVEAYEYRDVLAYDERGARIARGIRITPSLPAALGVSPVLGRGFTADDAVPGAPAVVVLSYETWQRDYGGARDVLGRAITLDEVSHVIVGVMPARWDEFANPIRADMWFPLVFGTAADTGFQFVSAVARLRPDASVDAANVEINALLERALAQAERRMFGGRVIARVARPAERVGAGLRDALFVLLGAVGLVLLVACSNVANLFLARSTSRARELALRSALGASAWRLARALLAECLVLALAAGAVGVAFGWLTLRVLARMRPAYLVSLGDVQLDPVVLAFTFGISVLTALLFGAAPALQLTSRRIGDALRSGASGVVRAGGARLRKLLVAVQMALSVILLVGAVLLVRSVIYLQNVEVGFDTQNLFTAQLSLPRARYETPTSRDALAEQLLERLRPLPSVAAVTQASLAPPNWTMGSRGKLEITGAMLSEAEASAAYASNYVRPDYFSTLGIRMLQGRTFTGDEMQSGAAVVVNRGAADRFWPEGNAVGAALTWGRTSATVVGVVDDVVHGESMQTSEAPYFYWPFSAERAPINAGQPPSVTLIVRAAGDPADAIAALRAETQALDPEVAVQNVTTSETAYAFTIAGPRFNMALLTAFAAIALVLAAVGLAAVIGYEVAERTHEFGVRMALGARTGNVRRLAMRHGLAPAFVGVVIGVIGALGATQLAASLLHGVAPRDPLTFVGVVALLVLVALGASWLPARRATRVDPITALRAE
jgi:putative ABC transport system permease protein